MKIRTILHQIYNHSPRSGSGFLLCFLHLTIHEFDNCIHMFMYASLHTVRTNSNYTSYETCISGYISFVSSVILLCSFLSFVQLPQQVPSSPQCVVAFFTAILLEFCSSSTFTLDLILWICNFCSFFFIEAGLFISLFTVQGPKLKYE